MDKAILLEDNGTFSMVNVAGSGLYGHRLVAIWWHRERKVSFGISRIHLTVHQVQVFASLVDKLSQEP